MGALEQAFARKALEFRDVLKMGRTQLQDAVPMTLRSSAPTRRRSRKIERALARGLVAAARGQMGATAIGTGLNAPVGYAASAIAHLVRRTDLPLVTAATGSRRAQDPGDSLHLLRRPQAGRGSSCPRSVTISGCCPPARGPAWHDARSSLHGREIDLCQAGPRAGGQQPGDRYRSSTA